jgi:hypothetical protein
VHDVVIVNSNREISLNIPPENPVFFIQGPTDEQFQVSKTVSFGIVFLDHLNLVRIIPRNLESSLIGIRNYFIKEILRNSKFKINAELF